MNSASPPEILTVLVAARNEAQSLPALHPRIAAVLKRLDGVQGRVLYVDDGSTDGTWEVMQAKKALQVEWEPAPATALVVAGFGKIKFLISYNERV